MDKKNKIDTHGIGFMSMLFLVFLVLKLTHVIDWSWFWITLPLWGPVTLVITGFIIYMGFAWYRKQNEHVRIKRGEGITKWEKNGQNRWKKRLEEIKEQQQRESDNF